MAKKRITELATETTLKDGQYVAIDHTTDGTKKLNLGAELTDLKEDLNEQVDGLKNQIAVSTRNILPKQPTLGAISVIDLGAEQTFANGVNISFDLLAFTGNGSAGIVTMRNASDTVVATVTLNGMRNVDTGKAYSAETSPHSGRYSSHVITALNTSLTFRYVRIVLNTNVVTSGTINNFMLTSGYNPTEYVPHIEANDYDLEALTNPVEINTAMHSISLMDFDYWRAKTDFYRDANGGYTPSVGFVASRLFPCKTGDALTYTLWSGTGTKVLFTFDENMQIVNTIDAGGSTAISGTYTFGSNEHYFAFNTMSAYITRIKLQYNTVPQAIRSFVSDLVGENKRYPEYWDTAINDALTAIKTQLLAIETGDCFVFVTDQHWQSNAQHSSELIDYISEKTGIYNVFIGGDVVNNKNATQIGAMTEMLDYLGSFKDKNIRLFSTLGNHDRNSVAQTDQTLWLSLAQQYNALIKPEEEWLDTNGTPLCNVYDNKSQKIRYIQFWYTADSGYSEDVATALVSAMTSTPNDYTIVLMSHAYWDGENPAQGAVAFANLILDTMDTITATVALWVCGHVHTDKATVITSNGGKSLRIMATTTDCVGQNPSNPSMTTGTTTEQAFDVYCIDTTAKAINAIRIGAGESRSYTY